MITAKRIFALMFLTAFYQQGQAGTGKDSTHKPFLANVYIGWKVGNNYIYPNSSFRKYFQDTIGVQRGINISYIWKPFGLYLRAMRENLYFKQKAYLSDNISVQDLEISDKVRVGSYFLGGVYRYRLPASVNRRSYLTFNTHAGIGFTNLAMPRMKYTLAGTPSSSIIEYEKDNFRFLTKHLSFDLVVRTNKAFALTLGYECFWGKAEMFAKDGVPVWQNFERIASSRLQFGVGVAF